MRRTGYEQNRREECEGIREYGRSRELSYRKRTRDSYPRLREMHDNDRALRFRYSRAVRERGRGCGAMARVRMYRVNVNEICNANSSGKEDKGNVS